MILFKPWFPHSHIGTSARPLTLELLRFVIGQCSAAVAATEFIIGGVVYKSGTAALISADEIAIGNVEINCAVKFGCGISACKSRLDLASNGATVTFTIFIRTEIADFSELIHDLAVAADCATFDTSRAFIAIFFFAVGITPVAAQFVAIITLLASFEDIVAAG